MNSQKLLKKLLKATASSAIDWLIKLFILCYALVRIHIHDRAELIKIENLIVAAYSFRLVESGAFQSSAVSIQITVMIKIGEKAEERHG